MAKYCVTFTTKIEVIVELEAETEDHAADAAWTVASEYLNTLTGDSEMVVGVDASLDGIGDDSTVELDAPPLDVAAAFGTEPTRSNVRDFIIAMVTAPNGTVWADLAEGFNLPRNIVDDMTLMKLGLIVWSEGRGFTLTDDGAKLAAGTLA